MPFLIVSYQTLVATFSPHSYWSFVWQIGNLLVSIDGRLAMDWMNKISIIYLIITLYARTDKVFKIEGISPDTTLI